jgi:hypothetical protein
MTRPDSEGARLGSNTARVWRGDPTRGRESAGYSCLCVTLWLRSADPIDGLPRFEYAVPYGLGLLHSVGAVEGPSGEVMNRTESAS